jgi:hypothetical protein
MDQLWRCQGLKVVVRTRLDLFPPFDYITAADIVVAYGWLGG